MGKANTTRDAKGAPAETSPAAPDAKEAPAATSPAAPDANAPANIRVSPSRFMIKLMQSRATARGSQPAGAVIPVGAREAKRLLDNGTGAPPEADTIATHNIPRATFDAVETAVAALDAVETR